LERPGFTPVAFLVSNGWKLFQCLENTFFGADCRTVLRAVYRALQNGAEHRSTFSCFSCPEQVTRPGWNPALFFSATKMRMAAARGYTLAIFSAYWLDNLAF
jgi:hypothetical protein